MALAYTFVQALQKAGQEPHPAGLLNAINQTGKTFVTPGFVPLSYSSSVHYGFLGERGHQARELGPAGGDADGQLDRRCGGEPGRT